MVTPLPASIDAMTAPLVFGYGFTADGTVSPLSWADVTSGRLKEFSRHWLHLNRRSPEAQTWLTRQSGLDRIASEALLQEDTRPRSTRHGPGFLINLRGMNLNEGEALEDMLALRMWACETALISLRAKPIQATRDIEAKVKAGTAPSTTGGLVAALADALTDRMEPEVSRFDEQADQFEDDLLDPGTRLPRSKLSELRRRVLQVRRYILPQREALAQLVREGTQSGLFSDHDLLFLRESADRVTRLAEELDTIRDRCTVLQEQVIEERAEVMNQRLFVLSILSTVFLPISFVTGLFGVNVGGMPGVDSAAAFAVLVTSLAVATLVMLAIFRWRRWI